jgi:hypothetical protein
MNGAGDGNRTHDISLEGWSFTIKLHPQNIKSLSIPVVGVEPTLQKEHDFESCASANSATPAFRMEAAPGFEPGVKVLQTSALPLGYAAITGLAGFEPTHDGVKVRCLTAWL